MRQYLLTKLPLFSLWFGLMALMQLQAQAAKIDCMQQTLAPIEKMICQSESLQQLDAQMSEIYNFLLGAGVAKEPLKQSQQKWLVSRDQCVDDACLMAHYQDRVAELKQAHRQALAYQPDAIDLRAIAELKQLVVQAQKINRSLALEHTLSQLEIKKGLTTFSNVKAEGDNSFVSTPPSKRPTGVSQDEWQAFVKSNIDAGGENGHASYTLLDINLDGQRDLILDSYTGGTGLFSYISVMSRKADHFNGTYQCPQKTECSESGDALYSLNGRGSNQSATWVKLQNRVYVAYRNSQYGVDRVTLLRPLYINEAMPTLNVYYEYALSVSKHQVNEGNVSYVLDDSTHTALQLAVAKVDRRMAKDQSGALNAPICPVPTDATEDERSGYISFGPGHYTFEIVSDVPVWLGQTCYVGQLVNWFGRYDEAHGLQAMLWMRLPNTYDDVAKEYQVSGQRKIINIDTGLASIATLE